MAATATDCRSRDGITVGLIDGLIAQCRILRQRLEPESRDGCRRLAHSVRESLADLGQDEDVQFLLELARLAPWTDVPT